MGTTLEGHVAVVTGGARGIGKEIAQTLAGRGAAVACWDIVGDKARETAQEIGTGGRKAIGLQVDITNAQQIKAALKETEDAFGPVDILVNNAGITRDGLVLRMSEEDWDAVLNVNLKGTFLCSKAIAASMVRKRWGRIISIASIIGLAGNAGQANYAASKAGVIGLTKTLARELASRNITANAVAPGYIDTPMVQALPEERRKMALELMPMKRLGSPADVAAVVAFLASDDANYITGQVITVDGGVVM